MFKINHPLLLNTFRFSLGILLGLQVLLLLLLAGKQPLLVHWLLPATPGTIGEGMRLAAYANPDRSGTPQIRYTSGAQAQLDRPQTSLEALAVWMVAKGGTVALELECDDYGQVFLDGHRIISLDGVSADNLGYAEIPIGAGPHLLAVQVINGPEKGFFRLRFRGPERSDWTPIPARDLHPWEISTTVWHWICFGMALTRTSGFWIALPLLVLLNLGGAGSRTYGQAVINTGLVAGSFLVALILGEIGARMIMKPPQQVTYRQGNLAAQDKGKGDQPFMVATPRGYRHRPNSEVVVKNDPFSPNTPLVFKTNSIGYRNREIGPKQGTRILFLGDSITFGWGINEEQTFVRLVENRARDEGKNWETVNGAVKGLGTNAELAILHETGLVLQPDMVVLGFYLNDFQESPGIFLRVLPGWLQSSWLLHTLVETISARLFLTPIEGGLTEGPMLRPPTEIYAWREEFKTQSTVLKEGQTPDPVAREFQEAVLANFLDWGGAYSPRVWDNLEVLLSEFVRLSQTHRFQFRIIAFPVRAQVEAGPLFDYPQQQLNRIARKLRVPLLDLLPLFREEYTRTGRQGDRLFLDHCHLNPYGNRIAAQAIYRFLEETPFKPGGKQDRSKD